MGNKKIEWRLMVALLVSLLADVLLWAIIVSFHRRGHEAPSIVEAAMACSLLVSCISFSMLAAFILVED